MKFNVTMEQPDAYMLSAFSFSDGRGKLIWIVGLEPQDCISVVLKHDRISPYGSAGIIRICSVESSRVRKCSFKNLELVPVKMPGMQVAVVIVDHNLDNIVMFDNIRIDAAIDDRIG